ncbi:MAG TPA: phosphopantetheine-binding protein [Thermoanaerobaculia bacterium]|nr:phosphopantetheine-binding protein [Thermoanaerobaculia bacterium]
MDHLAQAVERDEILAGIEAVAREHLGRVEPLTPELRLVEDLELDSIQLLTLAVEVENRFRVCLEPEDEAGIATVGDLAAAVAARLAEDQPAGAGSTGGPPWRRETAGPS